MLLLALARRLYVLADAFQAGEHWLLGWTAGVQLPPEQSQTSASVCAPQCVQSIFADEVAKEAAPVHEQGEDEMLGAEHIAVLA